MTHAQGYHKKRLVNRFYSKALRWLTSSNQAFEFKPRVLVSANHRGRCRLPDSVAAIHRRARDRFLLQSVWRSIHSRRLAEANRTRARRGSPVRAALPLESSHWDPNTGRKRNGKSG